MGQCKGVFTNNTQYNLIPVNSVVASSSSGPLGNWIQDPVPVPAGSTTNLAFFGNAPGDNIFIKVLYVTEGSNYELAVTVNNQPPANPTAQVYINTIPNTATSATTEGTGAHIAALYTIKNG